MFFGKVAIQIQIEVLNAFRDRIDFKANFIIVLLLQKMTKMYSMGCTTNIKESNAVDSLMEQLLCLVWLKNNLLMQNISFE